MDLDYFRCGTRWIWGRPTKPRWIFSKILEVVNLDLLVIEGAVVLIIRKKERETERQLGQRERGGEREIERWKKESEILGGKRKQKLEKEERGSHNTDMNYIQQQPPPRYIIFPKFTFSRAHYNVCSLREYHYPRILPFHAQSCAWVWVFLLLLCPSISLIAVLLVFIYLRLVLQWQISPQCFPIITNITIENSVAWNL